MKNFAITLLGIALTSCATTSRSSHTATITQGIAMNVGKTYAATQDQANALAALDFQASPAYLPSVEPAKTYEIEIHPRSGPPLYFTRPAKPVNFKLSPADQLKFEKLVTEIIAKGYGGSSLDGR